MGSLSEELRAKKIFDFYLKFILFFKEGCILSLIICTCVYIYVCICILECSCLRRPEGALGPPGAAVAGNCERPDMRTERQTLFLWVSEVDGSHLFNTEGFFFNGGNFMIYITNTIHISKQDTGGGSQYILLFAFCYLFLVSPFADFIPGEFHPRMQWNMIISAPPHLSLQLPFSPSHHISLPTSYTLSKTFSVDHMWMGVRQTPGAQETPPNKEWYFPLPQQLSAANSSFVRGGALSTPPNPCWTISWLHVVQVLCRCAHEHKAIFYVFMWV